MQGLRFEPHTTQQQQKNVINMAININFIKVKSNSKFTLK